VKSTVKSEVTSYSKAWRMCQRGKAVGKHSDNSPQMTTVTIGCRQLWH